MRVISGWPGAWSITTVPVCKGSDPLQIAGAREGLHLARVDLPAAVVADEPRLGDLPAGAVAQDDRRAVDESGVLVAPLHHRDDHGVEVQAGVGEPILAALPLLVLLVRPPLEDPEVDEPAEAVGEHVPGDPGRLQVVLERARPEIRGPEDG